MHESRSAPAWMGGRGRIFLTVAIVIGTVVVMRGPVARLFGGSPLVERTVTGVGERRTVTLPDGPRIELSVESTLAYSARLAATRRAAELSGEAHVSAPVDSARPLVVTALHAQLETTGATFVVRARPGESSVRVVVADGSVKLRLATGAKGTGRVIGAGQLARISPDGAVTHQDAVDVERFMAWRRGRILFMGDPMRDVLAELGRWHDVDLRIADSVVANRRVTAQFAATQTLTEMLDEIALGVGAVYQVQGGIVTFRRER